MEMAEWTQRLKHAGVTNDHPTYTLHPGQERTTARKAQACRRIERPRTRCVIMHGMDAHAWVLDANVCPSSAGGRFARPAACQQMCAPAATPRPRRPTPTPEHRVKDVVEEAQEGVPRCLGDVVQRFARVVPHPAVGVSERAQHRHDQLLQVLLRRLPKPNRRGGEAQQRSLACPRGSTRARRVTQASARSEDNCCMQALFHVYAPYLELKRQPCAHSMCNPP
eukprot:365087-Chlamydomonas_euryale.AAC.3